MNKRKGSKSSADVDRGSGSMTEEGTGSGLDNVDGVEGRDD